jgi:hypothetical protein
MAGSVCDSRYFIGKGKITVRICLGRFIELSESNGRPFNAVPRGIFDYSGNVICLRVTERSYNEEYKTYFYCIHENLLIFAIEILEYSIALFGLSSFNRDGE